MIATILDWTGTIFIIIGSIILAKKDIKLNFRLLVFIFYLVSNILWIPMSLFLGTYGLLLAQIILFFINIKGIIVCFVEIKGDEIDV